MGIIHDLVLSQCFELIPIKVICNYQALYSKNDYYLTDLCLARCTSINKHFFLPFRISLYFFLNIFLGDGGDEVGKEERQNSLLDKGGILQR